MSFDWLAPHYRWMEFLLAGEKLQRGRTAFLDRIPAPEKILLAGEGHGRCLVECARRFPSAQIACLESSAGMIEVARQRLRRQTGRVDRVEWIHADARFWTPSANDFDLIVTQFFLDCFPVDQLSSLIPSLARSAAPRANWLLADFQMAPSGLRRIRSRLILGMMYRFFQFAVRLPARSLSPPDPWLVGTGFQLRSRIESEWGLLHSDWWQHSRRDLEVVDQPQRLKEETRIPSLPCGGLGIADRIA